MASRAALDPQSAIAPIRPINLDSVSSPRQPLSPPLTGTRKRISTPVLAAIGPEKLRVALVCDWFLPRVGGLELHLRDLAKHLIALGHKVDVITTTPGDAVVEGVPVKRVEAKRLPGAGVIYTADGMRAVAQAVEQGQYDVVHAHVSIVAPTAYAGVLAAQRLDLPTVVTFHSLTLGPRFLFALVGRLLGMRKWHAIVSAVSTTAAERIAPVIGSGPVLRLPNGIDHSRWRIVQGPKDPNEVHLISVMRLNRKKRPATLVRLFDALRKQVPEKTFTLRIVGEGPERPRLERLIERRGLGDSVFLLGYRSREDIRELFSNADVFVLPAKLESFGLAALEARTAGLPVVAMADTGVADFIHEEREGLLATSDRHFLAQLVRISRDTALRERIAGFNQDRLPPVGWEGVIARHMRLYRESIAMRLPN